MSSMGQWKCSGSKTRAIVISSGVVAVESKDKEATADFSLKFAWLYDQLKLNPKAKEYKMTKWSYYGLIRSVAENKLHKLGEIFEETRTITITPNDIKREYQPTPYTIVPKCGGDILNRHYIGRPRDISLVQKKELIDMRGEE